VNSAHLNAFIIKRGDVGYQDAGEVNRSAVVWAYSFWGRRWHENPDNIKPVLAILNMLCYRFPSAYTDIADAPVSDTCGDNLTWTLRDGTLTISGTGDMYSFMHPGEGTSIAPWKDSCSSIRAIALPDDVDISECTLYVPAEAVEAYRKAEVWKEFKVIKNIE
jgi:hypothetical protein